MLVLLVFGFLAGVVTAISPCVLPVLPVLLAGGASGRKPYRIITGLLASFVVFTLFATWILGKLGLPDDLLRNIAIAFLFVLAATLIVPQIGLLLEKPFARLTRFRAGGGGFVLGASLGLVFVPCAGPVLGAISTAAATHHFGLRTILVTVVYAAGAAVPMLLIALGGRKVATRLRTDAPRLRIGSGIVIALVALAITFNLDSRFQTALPGYTSALQNHFENNSTLKKQLTKVTGEKTKTRKVVKVAGSGLPSYGNAPAIIAGGDWFNTKPLTLASLRGKVVLVDFWTYSCINCLRSLPHVESWYTAYHKDGLVVIGVHTPEFAFEHVASNVSAAVKRLGITYPVVQDNNYATWTNFSNQYWPAEYLIDQTGKIRGYSFGEGDYDTMEQNIKTLLGVKTNAKALPNLTPTESTTPESYLGFGRLDTSRYVGAPIAKNQDKDYTGASVIPLNNIAYDGAWKVESEKIVAGTNASLTLHFGARNVYLVLGGHGKVGVTVGGKKSTTVDVNAYKLYTLRSSSSFTEAQLKLTFTPGVQAYAFTFG